jgi:hypothetical protein
MFANSLRNSILAALLWIFTVCSPLCYAAYALSGILPALTIYSSVGLNRMSQPVLGSLPIAWPEYHNAPCAEKKVFAG